MEEKITKPNLLRLMKLIVFSRVCCKHTCAGQSLWENVVGNGSSLAFKDICPRSYWCWGGVTPGA